MSEWLQVVLVLYVCGTLLVSLPICIMRLSDRFDRLSGKEALKWVFFWPVLCPIWVIMLFWRTWDLTD